MKELKEFRSIIGLTTSQIAANIGVSKSLYEKVENGHRKPSNNFLNKLKKKYPNFDINIFFTK